MPPGQAPFFPQEQAVPWNEGFLSAVPSCPEPLLLHPQHLQLRLLPATVSLILLKSALIFPAFFVKPFYRIFYGLTASYIKIPAATEALSDSMLPCIGIFIFKSEPSISSREIPLPSFPIMSAMFSLRFSS